MNGTRAAWAGIGLMLSGACTAMDLIEAEQRATAMDPFWQARISEHLADQQGVAQAQAALGPAINAQASVNQNHVEPQQDLAPSLNYQQAQVALVGRQPLYRPDLWARLTQARALADVSESSLNQDLQARQLQVAQAYLQVSQAQAQQALLDAEVAALQRQHAAAQARYQQGVVARMDVSETRAQLQAAQANRIAAQNNLLSARQNLSLLTGGLDGHLAQLSPKVRFPTLDVGSAAHWWRVAEQANPQLQAARRQLVAAQASVDVARQADAPQLDAVGRLSTAHTHPQGLASSGQNAAVGLELNLPLWNGGQARLQTRQLQFQQDAARHRLDATRQQLRTRITAALAALASDQAQISAREQAVASSDEVSRATQAGQALGMRTLLDVLQARRNALAARQQLSDARHQYVIDYLQLHQLTGQLNQGILMQVNQWLVDQAVHPQDKNHPSDYEGIVK